MAMGWPWGRGTVALWQLWCGMGAQGDGCRANRDEGSMASSWGGRGDIVRRLCGVGGCRVSRDEGSTVSPWGGYGAAVGPWLAVLRAAVWDGDFAAGCDGS